MDFQYCWIKISSFSYELFEVPCIILILAVPHILILNVG